MALALCSVLSSVLKGGKDRTFAGPLWVVAWWPQNYFEIRATMVFLVLI